MLDGHVTTVRPEDIGAELALLALVVRDNAVFERLSDLKPDDFVDPVNSVLFEACEKLRSEGRPISLATLKGEAHGLRLGDGRDVVDYVRTMTFGDAPPDARDIARNLRELSARRKLLRIAEALGEMAVNYGTAPSAAIAETTRALDAVASLSQPAGKTLYTLAEAIEEAFRDLSSSDDPSLVPTGLVDLDRHTGGLRRREISILAGRPSMGKSSVATAIALGCARAGVPSHMFALEMSAKAVAIRAASEFSRRAGDTIPYADAVARRLAPERLERMASHAYRSGNPLPMQIDDAGGLTLAEIEKRVRRAKQRDPRLGLVMVDHLGKIAPSDRYKGNPTAETTEAVGRLMALAKAEDVHVMVLSQLNRASEGRENKRPVLADLRQSGAIEQDADIVMFCFRPAYYMQTRLDDEAEEQKRQVTLNTLANDLEIGIAKARMGITGTVDLFIDVATNFVCDKDRRHAA